MPAGIYVADHPLVQHDLAALRDTAVAPPQFRQLVSRIARALFYEASRDLELKPVAVATPVAEARCAILAEAIAFVPVLRAGLGMADALLDALPTASVWHLGLYRVHETLKPVTYYSKLPADHATDVAFVLDPMLATGGSACEAIRILKAAGVPRIRFIGLIAAPEGVQALRDEHPDVSAHLGAIDSHLNGSGYIVPGLGDAGDRQFGTW